MTSADRPRVFISRSLPGDEPLARVREAADVDLWEHERPPTVEELTAHSEGCDGLLTMLTETYGHDTVTAIGKMYVGFQPASFGGAVLGLIWGLADGFIVVTIVVLVYNALAGCGACCCSKQDSSSCDIESTT